MGKFIKEGEEMIHSLLVSFSYIVVGFLVYICVFLLRKKVLMNVGFVYHGNTIVLRMVSS